MVTRVHANNFVTTLNGAITSGATAMTLTSTTGLPTLSAGQSFNLTLQTGSTIEIVQVTAWSGSNITTMVRAQEGTTAVAWANGVQVALRATANSFDRKPDAPSSPTAYSVICAGTTSAGQLQATASAGSTGQVLTSAGSAALPTYSNPIPLLVVVQSTSITCAANTDYICTQGSLQTMTLPVAPAIGTRVGLHGTTTFFWKLAAGTGQTIKYLATTTTSGGSLTCTSQYDTIEVMYVATNTWSVCNCSIGGAITVA